MSDMVVKTLRLGLPNSILNEAFLIFTFPNAIF